MLLNLLSYVITNNAINPGGVVKSQILHTVVNHVKLLYNVRRTMYIVQCTSYIVVHPLVYAISQSNRIFPYL